MQNIVKLNSACETECTVYVKHCKMYGDI